MTADTPPSRDLDEYLEDTALSALILELRKGGSTVAYVGSPDRARRGRTQQPGSATVDFEIEVDGNLVGVDVTEFIPGPEGGRQGAGLDRLEELVIPRITQALVEARAGTVYCSLHFGRWPRKASMQAVADGLTEVVIGALPKLIQESAVTLLDPYRVYQGGKATGTELDPAIDGIELYRIAPSPDSLVIGSIDRQQTFWIGSDFEKLVNDLVISKEHQLDAYADGRLIIVHRRGLFMPQLLCDALSARSDAIPRSWREVYFVFPGLPIARVWPTPV